MSWTFIAMLLLVVGLIAANLALLKHGSKKNQRPLKNNKQQNSSQQQQKVQAAATTAPVMVQDHEKTSPEHDATASQNTSQDNGQNQV